MSGIYIPGMEMPKKCANCKIEYAAFGGYYCPFSNTSTNLHRTEERLSICPLVPVPPHGILNVLKTERECVSRDCDRNCGKCDLSLEQDEILSVFDTLIAMLADPADKEGE